MNIRKWAVSVLLMSYLGFLGWGIVGHALKIPAAGSALGYFVVWDMFCGWQAYDNRLHLIAEDSNGEYYRIREPWGAFQPFGHEDRLDYDVSNFLAPRHIQHVLEHSEHPPVDRVYVVQEVWGKQYNIPDVLWQKYYDEPKDKVSCFSLRAICTPDGAPIESNPDWFVAQELKSIADNPRLRQQAQSAMPYYNTFFSPLSANGSQMSAQTGGSPVLNTN